MLLIGPLNRKNTMIVQTSGHTVIFTNYEKHKVIVKRLIFSPKHSKSSENVCFYLHSKSFTGQSVAENQDVAFSSLFRL